MGGAVLELCKIFENEKSKQTSKRTANSVKIQNLTEANEPPTKKVAYPSFTGAQTQFLQSSSNSIQPTEIPTSVAPVIEQQPKSPPKISKLSNYFHKPPAKQQNKIDTSLSLLNKRKECEVEVFNLVDSPVIDKKPNVIQTISSSSSFFDSGDDDCLDEDIHEILNNVEKNSIQNKKEPAEIEFLIDQISGVPSTTGTVKVKAAIIKTRNKEEKGKLFVNAIIDDGTKQMEVIVNNKLVQQYQMGENRESTQVEGIMILQFPKDGGLPILEDISPINSCHIRSLLGQVRNWGQ